MNGLIDHGDRNPSISMVSFLFSLYNQSFKALITLTYTHGWPLRPAPQSPIWL